MRYATPGRLAFLAFISLVAGVLAPFVMTGLFGLVEPVEPAEGELKPQAKDWAILAAAGVGIAGFLFNSAVKFHSEMCDRAFQFLKTAQENRILLNSMNSTGRFFKINTNRKDIINEYKRNTKLRQSIRDFGNFCEEMAIAIKYREVNESILEEFYSSMFIRFYDNIRNDILPEIRRQGPQDNPWSPKEPTRPLTYENLDWLYKRWTPRNLEWIGKHYCSE